MLGPECTFLSFLCLCMCVYLPVSHGLLSLHNVACDWLSSISRWLPADEGGVMVHFLYYGCFGSVGHLCDGNEHSHRGQMLPLKTQYMQAMMNVS